MNSIIDKSFIYEQLNKIHKEKHIDVAPYFALMVGKNEIPYEVVVFINKHTPIDSLSTYNKIYEKRKRSPLFKNIIDEELPIEEKAIVLSSLLTQSLIGIKHADKEFRDAILDTMNVNIILDAISQYMNDENEEIIQEVSKMYCTIFKALFNR